MIRGKMFELSFPCAKLEDNYASVDLTAVFTYVGAAQAEDAAQYHPVSAVVTSMEDGEPIVGAMVMITDGGKNGRSGGVTDSNGKFSLRVPNNASVRISCIGYASQSFQVKQPMLNEKVVLEPNRTEEEKAVVTGMSKRSMTSFTGNFVSVKGEELRRMNPNNILEGLQFFDPSFKIVENNATGSDPNATPQFNIRGDQTLGNNVDLNSMDLLLDNVSSRPNTPLFVLDGFIGCLSHSHLRLARIERGGGSRNEGGARWCTLRNIQRKPYHTVARPHGLQHDECQPETRHGENGRRL